jgi:membrane protease YdiL (CAAX protease family)
MAALLLMLWRKAFAEPFQRSEEESRAWLASPQGKHADREVLWVLVVAAVSLTLLEYVGKHPNYERGAAFLRSVGLPQQADELLEAADDPRQREIVRLTWWGITCLGCYLVLPAAVIRLVFKKRLADYGLRLDGMFQDVWIYGLMFAGMIPIVLAVSYSPRFLAVYPFYKLAPGESLWPRFLAYEMLYILQFVALEFFFRGFLVHGTRRRFGFYSVLVMMIPYAMIHFGKPMLETLAAIAAGIVLGSMSLKTRSVIMGAALHVGVALTMDGLALWHKELLSP